MEYLCLQCGAIYQERPGWCIPCMGPGMIVPKWRRPGSVHLDGHLEHATAAELVKKAWDHIPVEAYPDLRIAPGSMVVVYGPPAAGKSTWLIRVLDSVSGSTLLCALEEGIGPTVSERLSRLGVRSKNFIVVGRGPVDGIFEMVRSKKVVAVGIDSVQSSTLTPSEIRSLCSFGPVVICVAQIVKDGGMAGRMRWPHEADVVVKVENMQWEIEKSRYQEPLTGAVL